ncbi:MAG: efflux RND transporter permease subunit [Desulfobacterales bacterium]|nr:efflux RND transporter permease subunit [Desulfobacterales bacterium]MDD4071603.1 efflux RND transporter permease subunit [Desulfobacterales bacterium]MDD4392639.1 efflux RND transporter permease subunit [Desulfobacterales bacterium]
MIHKDAIGRLYVKIRGQKCRGIKTQQLAGVGTAPRVRPSGKGHGKRIERSGCRRQAHHHHGGRQRYENQLRAQKTLSLVLPLALFIIFMILYFQFRSVLTTFMVFSGILVAWAGGFFLIWLYAKPWFLNFSLFDMSMRDLFQVHPVNLSVAIWVGFLALFDIASDDGVLMATYLNQSFSKMAPESIAQIRESTREGALQRVRPALMTSATTILALIPVLTSTGRGSDIMVPMAIPSFGGMLVELITLFVVPVLYCGRKEIRFHIRKHPLPKGTP